MAWAQDTSERTETSRTDVLRASPPMFESRLLDACSRVHPLVPVLIFGPAIAVLVAWSLANESVAVTIALAIGGYGLWTLFEYWLHRIVFHFEPDHGIGARLHWIIHGIHHEHPNDPLRLVMPPAVSVPLGAIVFGLLYLAFGSSYAPGAGSRVLRRISGVRHDPLLPAPLHPARAPGPDAARASHAPPLSGRHPRLRDQRAVLGRGLPHLLARELARALAPYPSRPAATGGVPGVCRPVRAAAGRCEPQ